MQLLDDIDAVYTKVKDATIGYLIGYGIAIIISLAFLIALLSGWSPIPKRISDQPRSTLQDPFVVKDGMLVPRK